eukprot:1436901-Amphidinium_carterae.1
MAVGGDGKVYVVGETRVRLDGYNSYYFLIPVNIDAFLMQYDASGAWQWPRQRGSSSSDYAYAVAVSGDGKVYVAGYTGGSLDGQSSAGNEDAFLMQFDATG